MSLLGKIFSKNKTEKPPTIEEAVNKLFETEELLKKQSELLETKIEEQIEIARNHGSKNKRLAIKALKTKKRYEKRLNEIDGTLTTLEYQRENLQNAHTNADILKTMGLASNALKTINKDFDIDKIDDLKNEIADQHQLANEINNVISTPMAFDNDFDEDELMQELEELQNEDVENKMPDLDSLPEVPSKDLSTKGKGKKEKEDLSDLLEWAS